MKSAKFMIVPLALCSLCPGAFAQQAGPAWYLYGASGATNADLDQGGLDGLLRGAGATGISSSVKERYSGYKLQGGYAIDRTFAVEAGWVDLGKFSYNAAFTGGSANARIKVTGINAAGVATWPIADRLSLFGRLGALYAQTRADAGVSGLGGSSVLNAKDKGWAPNLGVGVAYDLTRTLALRAEYERFFNVGDSGTTGKADVDLLSVGVKFSFR